MPKLCLFNTEAREKVEFKPRTPGHVDLYTCGPTVYDYAHIGNFRTYVFEDLLRRTLRYFGYQVKQVMNITDFDDKTIRGATRQGISLDAYTKPFTEAFFEDLATLGIQKAEEYPAATSYIKEMIEMIDTLLKKGNAYVGKDGSVYFKIESFARYGCLSHLKLGELKTNASERVSSDEYEKESVADFVLWKAYDPERDGAIYWDSPYGKGRPGWHLECSCMATEILGPSIDIHCGGVDNMFPHHENEIAQSEACSGKKFANYWLHSEHLLVDGKKMSKSLGNFHTLRGLLEKGFSGTEVRLMLLQTHYKTQLNFTLTGLEGAKNALARIQFFIKRMQGIPKEKIEGTLDDKLDQYLEATSATFAEALADDLNISVALGALYDCIRDINGLADAGALNAAQGKKVLNLLKKFNEVLGIMSFEEERAIPPEILELASARTVARTEKNWKKADEIRALITSKGYSVEDTPAGPVVRHE